MTELELVYKVLSTSAKGRINNSDSLSERIIRNMLLEHRNNLQLNFTSNGRKIPQSLTQDFNINVTYDTDRKLWVGTIPNLLDLGKNRSLVMVHDFSNQLSVNYGKTTQQSLFSSTRVDKFKSLPTVGFNHRTNKLDFSIDVTDIDRINKLKPGTSSADLVIDGVVVKDIYELYCVAALYNPEEANNGYDWKRDPFPMSQTLELPLMESVRKEYNAYVITES